MKFVFTLLLLVGATSIGQSKQENDDTIMSTVAFGGAQNRTSSSNFRHRKDQQQSMCKSDWVYNACCGGCGKSFSKKTHLIRAINDFVVDKKYARKAHGRINCWDVSRITNMEELFYSYRTFNSNINCWDVSKVTKMNSMFQEASSFNRPLNRWKLNNVENLTFMFSGAASFQQNLCSWHDMLPPEAQTLSMFSYSKCPSDTDPIPGDRATTMCESCY
jgi:hypothetical protein